MVRSSEEWIQKHRPEEGIFEVLMMQGCPCCDDGEPKIVTYSICKPAGGHVDFSGLAWTVPLMNAVVSRAQMRIMMCEAVE